MLSGESIVQRLISYAEGEPRIQAMVLFGSRARAEKKADKFSDYDLIFFVSDVDYFIHTDKWLRGIAEPKISFVEPTAVQDYERRVFFDNAVDMDFLFYNVMDVERITADPIIQSFYEKGYKILVDKIDYARLVASGRIITRDTLRFTDQAYMNQVNDFWFHTIWSTKKMRRGEIWAAKNCIDGYLKNKLREMLEQEALARNGAEFAIWHDGRFFDEWVDPTIRSGIGDAYGKYDSESLRVALDKTMDLFADLAKRVAPQLQTSYPSHVEEYARRMLLDLLE